MFRLLSLIHPQGATVYKDVQYTALYSTFVHGTRGVLPYRIFNSIKTRRKSVILKMFGCNIFNLCYSSCIIPNYSQQDATFLNLFTFTDVLHVLGGSSGHHQEHIIVHTASGIVNQYCC